MIRRVNFRGDAAKHIRQQMRIALKSQFEGMGDDLAGYALVTWDHRGECHTAYLTNMGPIGAELMPGFVHGVLSRHVTLEKVKETNAVPGSLD